MAEARPPDTATKAVVGADSPCPAAPCADAFGVRIWNRQRTPGEICADSGRTDR